VRIAADEAVPAALFAFIRHIGWFTDAVLQAVHLGGDTDTIAAMTGALAGAFHGVAAIPERCRARLERVSVSTPWPMICSRRCETAFRNLGGTATGRRQRAGIHTRKRAPPPLAVRDTVTPPL
jgi:hypothetical protein